MGPERVETRADAEDVPRWEFATRDEVITCDEDSRDNCSMEWTTVRISVGRIERLARGAVRVLVGTEVKRDNSPVINNLGHILTLRQVNDEWVLDEYGLVVE